MANLLSTTVNGQLNTGNVIDLGYTVNGSVATTAFRGINFHSFADYNYLIGKRAGAWTQPLDIAFYTGIKYHAHSSYGGHKFYTGGFDSTFALSIGDGDGNVRISNTLHIGDNSTGLYLEGSRLRVRSTSVDNVVQFATYGIYLPQTGQTAGLYVESPIEARGGLRIGSDASSGTITVGADTSVVANRIVQRDANGYIYANHINFSTSESENPAISSFITSNGDGWSRKSSLAHVRNQLGNYGSWITTDGRAYPRRSDGTAINFYWDGQNGQPTYLWGSNNGVDFYVWNPSNFSVNFANSSTSAAYLNYTGVGATQINANTFGYGRASNYYGTGQILNSPEGAYASLYNFGGTNESGLSLQMFASVNHNDTASTRNLWFRVGNNLGFQNDWKQVIHSGNIGSQSVTYATTAGSAPNAGNINHFYNVTAGVGNGLRFWGDGDYYKISMGVGGLYQYGPVTDYSIKTQMDAGSTGRGFTWGNNGVTPVAALNATSGNMQIAGTFTASNFSGSSSGTNTGDQTNISGNSATTSQIVFSDLKINFPSGAGGGHSFASNHYSMGLDSGNGGWDSPHYRDVIIGYHTGIRIGANYSGVRFYDNSPTTDANNDGNGDGAEKLLMTIGGYVGTANHTDVVVNNNLFANVSMRAPIFYDSQDTSYYGDFAGTSNLNFLNLGNTREEFPLLKMGAAGRYALGVSGAYTRLSSHNQGSGVQLGYYDGTTFTPRLTVSNDGNVVAESSFRAPIFYDSADTTYYVDPAGNGTRAAFLNGNVWISPKSESYGEGIAFLMPSQATWGGLRWLRGVNNFTGAWAFGYFGNESNDNIGFHSAGVNGWRLDHSWNMTVIGSVRAPIFYDSDDTGYSWNPNTTNAHRFSTPNGYVDIGPMNGSWCHFQTDRPRFYFGNSVTIDGDLKRYSDGALYIHSANYNSYAPTLTGGGASGSWGISVTGSAGGVAWGNVSSKPSRWLNATNLIDDNAPDTTTESGFWQSYLGSGNPTGTWFNYVNVRHSNPANAHGYQIGMSYYDNNLWFRSYQGSGTYQTWSRALGTNTDPYPSNMNQYVRTTDDVTHNSTTSPLFLVNGHSDNTKGYRIHNTSGSSVSAMFTNSSNQLVIAAGAVDQINLNKKVYVNGVALGVNIAPSATAGRIDASNDIVAYSSSDERLKQNITPIANALDKVKSLTGVEFDWKPEHKEAHGHEGHDTGIIAQQVLGVMPSAVRTNDTGYLAVRYEKLIGLLIEGMKEQQSQIEELKAKLDGLTK